MKPAVFDYLRARSVEEALEHLASYGDRARVMAGGQSLMAMMNFRLAAPELVIDIATIDQLGSIRTDGDAIEVGAAVTQAALLAWPSLAAELPLVAGALPWVGHFQTRNRGTVCGSIVHADPSSELPLCLATLAGEVILRSVRGTRRLGAAEFQLGMMTTARESDELVTAVRFPRKRAGEGYAFDEVARRHGDFAILALAAKADAQGAWLGLGGIAGRPEVRAIGAASGAALDDLLNDLAWELGGTDDIHASARYRRELVRRLGPKVIAEARARCRS